MHRRGHTFVQLYRVEKALSDQPQPAYEVTQIRLGTPLLVTPILDLSDPELSRDDLERLKQVLENLQARLTQAAHLEHPRLVRLVDSFEEDKIHYAVLERVQGRTLRGLMEQSMAPLDEDVATDFTLQLLDLLSYLQQRKTPFILGNLSPDTIIVHKNGQLEVCDLNLHGWEEAPEPTGFVAPELLGEAEVDSRADLYSLGALAYYALTGQSLPPLWDRVTQTRALVSPGELGLQVKEPFWTLIQKLVELPTEARPKSPDQVAQQIRDLAQGKTKDLSLSWYPEQSDLPLGDSYPYAPLAAKDWILKMVQAAVVGRARELEVKQDREACRLTFRLAAPDVPAPRQVLTALCDEPPGPTDFLDELAAGLRTVGEFRDFSLTLDDWERSWTLRCVGGRISAAPGKTSGVSGMRVEVRYIHAKRTDQSTDELIRLERKTRLCPVPITLDGRPLQPDRYSELPAVSRKTEVLYLASVSLAEEAESFLTQGPGAKSGERNALTTFAPNPGPFLTSHVDVRCYVSKRDVGKMLTEYTFIRQPSRVLLYHRGVMCGWKNLKEQYPLQFDVHLHSKDLKIDNSGLELETPDRLGAAKEQVLERIKSTIPTVKMKLEEHWENLPREDSPKGKALMYGMAPVMTLFLGKLVLPGFVLAKMGLMGGAALSGTYGYLNANSSNELVRKACLEAIKTYEEENL